VALLHLTLLLLQEEVAVVTALLALAVELQVVAEAVVVLSVYLVNLIVQIKL
jgi:hypothetical protein